MPDKIHEHYILETQTIFDLIEIPPKKTQEHRKISVEHDIPDFLQ